jgi:23S rRNA pseudouridine1911/1915/1917 synthase
MADLGDSSPPLPRSQWVVSSAEAGVRLDAYLSTPWRLGSRGRVRKALERGKLLLNGHDVTPGEASRVLVEGDQVQLWTDRPGSSTRRMRGNQGSDRELHLLYEDDALIVVNKPAGLLTVPLSRREQAASVETLLLAHLRTRGKRRPLVVHRIDRDTSGLVLFAKTLRAQRDLKAQFASREAHREYLAVVRGVPGVPQGEWTDVLAWDHRRLRQTATHQGDPRGRPSRTEYWIVEALGGASLLRLRLVTGRRNQIRIQAGLHGFPLIGEHLYYDGAGQPGGLAFARQALHAAKLGFWHPVSRKWAQFEAPLPEDMQHLLHRLRLDSPKGSQQEQMSLGSDVKKNRRDRGPHVSGRRLN